MSVDDDRPRNPNKNHKNGNEWYNTSRRKVARWYLISPEPTKRVGGVIEVTRSNTKMCKAIRSDVN